MTQGGIFVALKPDFLQFYSLCLPNVNFIEFRGKASWKSLIKGAFLNISVNRKIKGHFIVFFCLRRETLPNSVFTGTFSKFFILFWWCQLLKGFLTLVLVVYIYKELSFDHVHLNVTNIRMYGLFLIYVSCPGKHTKKECTYWELLNCIGFIY